MENVRKYVDIRIVKDGEKFRRLTAKKNYKNRTLFTDNNGENCLVAVHMAKTHVTISKPIQIGASILELSKDCMYDYWYNYCKNKWRKNISLAYTDTDSLVCRIQTEDFYEDIKDNIFQHFDTSNYQKNHMLYTDENEKVLGNMKDEAGGKIIEEVIFIRAKCYSILMDTDEKCFLSKIKEEIDGKNSIVYKRAKGISKSVTKKILTHQDYRNCVEQNIQKSVTVRRFDCNKHEVYTKENSKIALDNSNDQRYILPDGINTMIII